MSELLFRINQVKARVANACLACGRAGDSVEILPVSKFQSESLIREVGQLGYSLFGENYVQEGSAKALHMPDLGFVLTGPLQRNKAKSALQYFREIMSVDRVELVARLRNMASELDVVRPIWIQIDLWHESTKVGGCSREELPALLDALGGDARLPLKGFMAIPPPHQKGCFQEVAVLRDEYQNRLGGTLLLSMGMSDDMEEAIAAGSDQVRIGTAIFGSR